MKAKKNMMVKRPPINMVDDDVTPTTLKLNLRWLRDHPSKQVIGNVGEGVRTRSSTRKNMMACFPISDEKHAQELHMQEALMSSAAKTQTPGGQAEAGESSQAFCEICMDTKAENEMFRSNSCRHSYCSECIGRHVSAKIQEKVSAVKCPDVSCKGIIEPQHCRSIIPTEVLERWETALRESLIIASQKFYCPYKDCSAMLVDDWSETTVSECSSCRRLFCAQCMVTWHAGIDCREFQLLNEDERGREDVMLMELAKDKQWKRCPCCKFYVEKIHGCNHISCRRGQDFCYGCGAKYSFDHDCSYSSDHDSQYSSDHGSQCSSDHSSYSSDRSSHCSSEP